MWALGFALFEKIDREAIDEVIDIETESYRLKVAKELTADRARQRRSNKP